VTLQTLEQIRTNYSTIRPQDGPQTEFLSTSADIAIYGGAAGGGKTWALLLEPLRHIANPAFGAVVFRRTSVQVRNEGGLWDESLKLYNIAGGKPREHDLWWKFPSGASISFAHLEHDKNVYDWQGSQIPLICFDELTHFTEGQFWYMLSRNRSTCGVQPYVRATCNPDVDSWVAQFIAWWINQDTGYVIPERAGKLRWFVRIGENLIWADSPAGLLQYRHPLTGEPIPPKSVTFIPSSLADNHILMMSDPGYMANLMALPLVERERLLNGNWRIRWQGLTFFELRYLLVNDRPVPYPQNCDAIFAILDTASKTGVEHDGTGVMWCARSRYAGHPLIILDWDLKQIEGALLEAWLPSVFARGEELALACGARNGFVGAWAEDKASGIVLIQQSKRKNLALRPIESKLTALGKDERALSVSGYVIKGEVKLSEHAYNKVVTYKNVTRNHLINQVENFSIGDENNKKRADDLFDCFTYSVALGLGNSGGF
jgi:hypothetical protein